MRVDATGANGQAAASLVQKAGPEIEILTASRPAFPQWRARSRHAVPADPMMRGH
jgi:hypothetical protein